MKNSEAPSPHRAPPVSLPADPTESAAYVLRYIQTAETGFDRSSAIEAHALRLAKLQSPDAAVVVSELQGHSLILDALFQRYSAMAIGAKAEQAAIFVKLALASQAAYTRTLIAAEGLKAQRMGAARVVVNAIDDDDDIPFELGTTELL